MWLILQDSDFAPDKDRHLAWRLTAGELRKRAEAAVEAELVPKRRRYRSLKKSHTLHVALGIPILSPWSAHVWQSQWYHCD